MERKTGSSPRMHGKLLLLALPLVFAVWTSFRSAPLIHAESGQAEVRSAHLTESEAQDRARLLHETLHATLHYVHQDYYREEEGLPIPAASLTQVFHELAQRQGVALRWLAVNARAMNVDHRPRNSFETEAVRLLASGQDEYGAVEQGTYRHAAAIPLGSECLNCHLPGQTRAAKRLAALVIEIPIRSEDATEP